MSVDEVADRLYALPPEEFTSARNEAERELRQAGEREQADQVKALRKPSAAAGAVNRLVRNHGTQVEAFLDAAARLRDAQFAGKGDLGAAAQAERLRTSASRPNRTRRLVARLLASAEVNSGRLESSFELSEEVCADDQSAIFDEITGLLEREPDAVVAVVHSALAEEGQLVQRLGVNDCSYPLVPGACLHGAATDDQGCGMWTGFNGHGHAVILTIADCVTIRESADAAGARSSGTSTPAMLTPASSRHRTIPSLLNVATSAVFVAWLAVASYAIAYLISH
jgi:hypothetical protein